jgi:hypothetical protein
VVMSELAVDAVFTPLEPRQQGDNHHDNDR